MQVIVAGCGRVGSAVARRLDTDGHEVSVLDIRSDAFVRLGPDFGGRTTLGVAFDLDTLSQAGAEDADAFAAVTSSDNVNMVAARVAHEHFEIDAVVARIYDIERGAVLERLGVPSVASVGWATQRVLERLVPDVEAVEWTDASASVCLVERKVPTRCVGKPIQDFEEPGRVRILAISRLGVAQIPHDELLVQDGDLLHVAVLRDYVDTFDAQLADSAERS